MNDESDDGIFHYSSLKRTKKSGEDGKSPKKIEPNKTNSYRAFNIAQEQGQGGTSKRSFSVPKIDSRPKSKKAGKTKKEKLIIKFPNRNKIKDIDEDEHFVKIKRKMKSTSKLLNTSPKPGPCHADAPCLDKAKQVEQADTDCSGVDDIEYSKTGDKFIPTM